MSSECQSIKAGGPKKVKDKVMLKAKEVIIGIHLARAGISRNMVISIGAGVLKVSNPNSLLAFGGHVILTDIWARSILKSMDRIG